MSDTTVDADSIGPQLNLEDVPLPPAVGEQLAAVYGHEEAFGTAADWIRVTREAVGTTGSRPTVEDLCTSADGRHTFEGRGESQSYVCVLDPLAYPFLTDTPGTVRSETPVRGETVTFEVRPDGAAVSPDGAVVSLGAAADTNGTVTPTDVYRQVCGYIHAFADEAEYERWAAESDGVTTAVPAMEGLGLARELATELIERPD